MEDVGTARFSDDEVESLRAYLLKGGFLEVDDFWGTRGVGPVGRGDRPRAAAGRSTRSSTSRRDHPIMHTLYDVKEVEQVSTSASGCADGGSVSERGSNDSPHVNFRGIQDEHGRLMVVMTHNTDIPDTWEREGESQEYFDRFSPNGYAIGVNIVIYAMTH